MSSPARASQSQDPLSGNGSPLKCQQCAGVQPDSSSSADPESLVRLEVTDAGRRLTELCRCEIPPCHQLSSQHTPQPGMVALHVKR